MGGFLFFGQEKAQQSKQPAVKKNQIEKVDQLKFKLKKARDTIKKFANAKKKDLGQIEQSLAEKVPTFKETGDKRQILPLLKAKKDLLSMIEKAEVRLKLLNSKLDQVQMQKVNADTIDTLQQANIYMRDVQQHLDKKDWRNVIAQAQQKYESQWPQPETDENDTAFQEMWKELGGDQVAKSNQAKAIEKKRVAVETNNNPAEELYKKTQTIQNA